MSELSKRVGSLSPRQKELLMQRLRRQRQSGASEQIKPQARDTNMFPLSFAQQRLWFLERLEPGGFAYNITIPTRFTGKLDTLALTKGLNEIARRHEVLRTTFAERDGEPRQVIAPSLDVQLPLTELQHLSEVEREHEVERIAIEEMRQPFDLVQGPLWRCRLLRLGESEHVFILTMHHIVTDAWSTGLFFQELTELYEAFNSGRPPQLPTLAIQYADFAQWQREWMASAAGQAQLDYWKRHLAGRLTLLKLPTSRPRPEARSFRGATHLAHLSKEITRLLTQLGQREGATLYMTLLAAFSLLLQRHSAQEEIVIGTDIANRSRRETEALIGFFINILVLRLDLSGDPPFRELLARVRDVSMAAYAHEDMPFDRLVVELETARELNRSPLFQVLFVMQNAPQPVLNWSGVELSPIELKTQTARFDLAVFVEATEQGMTVKWNYSIDLFDASVIERLADRFEALLKNICAQPEAKLSALEICTEAERLRQETDERDLEQSSLRLLRNIKPKPIRAVRQEPVTTGYLTSDSKLPLVLTAASEEVDLTAWADAHLPFIQSQLLTHGALLFRNFNLRSASDFERAASAICPELFAEYGDLPREEVSGRIYGSTPYPSNQPILFHNESSHLHHWPMKIWFYCLKAAEQGGETPIVDCRRVYRLLRPETRERFAHKGIMYVRNYMEGLDVSWQDFFRTGDRAAVERQCREAAIDFEWRGSNVLRTRKIAVAVTEHPGTGETVFFNQIQLHHASYLLPEVRQSLWSTLGEDGLPRNAYYGDGSPIEDEVMKEIDEAYSQSAVSFKWMEGDLLMLDNMLTAHARNRFVGERKIYVAMGEMCGLQKSRTE